MVREIYEFYLFMKGVVINVTTLLKHMKLQFFDTLEKMQ